VTEVVLASVEHDLAARVDVASVLCASIHGSRVHLG